MTYEEVEALQKGDRVAVHTGVGKYRPGTVRSTATLMSGPSLWIAFDDDPKGHSTNVTTGMQFYKEAWDGTLLALKFRTVDESNE